MATQCIKIPKTVVVESLLSGVMNTSESFSVYQLVITTAPWHSMQTVESMTNKMFFLMILYLIMEGGDLIGQHAVLVYQETEASLLLQQSLLTAICEEQLHVHLTACQRFQALTTNTEGILCQQNSKSIK